MNNIDHEAAALDYLAAATATSDTLHELLEAKHLADRNARVAEAHRRVGHALKLADVHATLAVAQATRQGLAPRVIDLGKGVIDLADTPGATGTIAGHSMECHTKRNRPDWACNCGAAS